MSQGETARIRIWIERLQTGDEGALNELLVHFERRLRSLTRRMLRNYPLVHAYEQTDDVFQKAVLRLCRALKAITPKSTSALFGLSSVQIRRELLNLARHYRSRPDLLHRASAVDWHPDGAIPTLVNTPQFESPRSDNELELLDQWAAFHDAAAALPEPRREAFDLIWYQGLSCEEVARIQQVSSRTVRNRWNAARQAIYEALDGNLPGC